MDEIEVQCDSTLATSIKEEMLQQLPLNFTKCNIYRVPRRQRNVNPIAYTPQVISIGPFHHGREHLIAMERHKLQALLIYLQRANLSIEAAITTAQNWEREARGCYAEPINMNHKDFVKMMLKDGCFLVEFMILGYHSFSLPHQSLTLDCSFYAAMGLHLCYDLIMLENQLPLFVLERLFNQLPACEDSSMKRLIGVGSTIPFMELVYKFLEDAYLQPYNLFQERIANKNTNHLVHLLSGYCKPAPDKEEWKKDETEKREFLLPPTLTELWEAGVTIKKAAKEQHWMNISFKHGVLEIPYLEITDQFETRVRNLMAFEHYHLRISQRYVTNYVSFLDGLISTGKDVSLLVKAEILINNIGGSNEEVSKLFNDLCKEITLPGEEYYYYNMTKDLSEHCKKPQHRWMASLRRDYFNTPWSSISFVAATLLILFTFIQTLYSHLSYVK